ncbi:protein ABHD11 [Cephus cinctus]|uniref:sn-1-specific diacylglycerol lipase ABHD11 n=1 Tax=Cephus cinctus TaxID=211228 RepID=A0AAJ7BXR0_CEPCN|nr:protein ABHD11 [Cephus cinctus]
MIPLTPGLRHLTRKSLALLPLGNHYSCRELNTATVYSTPVKLAYVSYESTKEEKNHSKRPPILIMHGLFGSKNNWNSLAKAIHQKTNCKVIAIDGRNHGDSPHSPEVSYAAMAEDVVHLLKDLEIPKAVLVGHSMGGGTMMYTALNNPELVEKLVVVDFSPVGTSPSLLSMTKIFQAMKSVSLDGNVSLSKARKMIDEQLSSSIRSLPLRQFLLTNLVEAETGKYKWRINLPALEKNFAKQIAVFPKVNGKRFDGSTLFLGGADSDYIRIEDHAAIGKLFPNAKFHYIAGAGHWVHADKPTEFLDILTSFIDEKQ